MIMTNMKKKDPSVLRTFNFNYHETVLAICKLKMS